MLDPFAQPSLATARRSRATVDPFQYARTDASRLPRPATTSRRKTPQEIEAEAYEDERKRLESEANDRQKQEQAAAKAALKAQNDAAEAAFRKEGRPFFTNASGQILPTQDDQTYLAEKQRKAANDAKASEYFQLSRPFRYDAQGNVVPRHTDEEWDAQKKAKAAELEAAKIDKANKDYRNQVRGGIDQQQAVLSSNDDMIQRRTQELQLAAENARAEVSKRKRFIEDAKKRLDEMAPADTQFDSVAAAAEKMQAELDEYQAQADAADEESRRQQAAKLSFDKDQDVLKGRLRQEEVGVDSLTAPTTSAQPVTGITPVGSMPTPRPPATATPGVRDQVLAGRVDAIAKDATLDDAARKAALTQLQLRRKDPAAYQTAVNLEFEQADAETLEPKLEQQMQAHEQRLADLQARTQAFTQKRDQVMNGVQVAFQRAQQRLAGPHTAGDLVTVPSPDGEKQISMPRDVAEGYMMSLARAKQWQDANQAEADLLEIESDEANLDAQLLNEGVRVLNAKRQAGVQRQAAERQQHLADLAASGHETQVRKIQGLDQEAEARLADIEEMYPENSPEREAAVKAIEQDIASKKQGVGQEIGEQAQKAARLYQDWGRGFAGNWITGETPEVDDESRTGAVMDENVQAVLKAKAKELGMSEKDLRHHLETQRLMDWSTPSTSASNAQQSGVAHELAKKLDLIGVAEPTRTLPSGDIMPNPELGQSQAKFDEAIDSAIGTQEAKDKAKALWPQYREMWLESARATLETSETLPGVESYQDWRDKNNAHLAGMSENQKAELYIEKMEKRGVFRKFLDNVSANLMAGSHDILTAIYGTGAVLTGAVEKATGAGTFTSQLLSEQAAEKSQQAQKLTQAQGIEGISGLGQGIVGQSARMAPGAIATMATGTMTGAMVAGAMQTGGMTYADAYHSLIEDGNSHADAWSQAAPASIAAGAMTAVLTKAFPGGVTALNNAANRSALQQGIQQAIRTFAASATSMGKAAVKGFADEVPQEILDEAFSQFAQGQAQGRAPREVVSEFLTGLPELIGAAGLMGAGGEIMGSRQSQTPPAGAADAMAETPSPAPSLVGAAPSSEPEAAPPVAASVGAADGGAAPEKWAAAEAALANFSQTTTLPAEVADKTAQKAQVLLKIAQGAKADSLDNDDLHLVGLHRDDAGKITQGYMSKNGWKKGPNPNGSPQPVEVLNGEFIITQRQIERLRNKEVGLGALADAIALPAEERRAQILAKEQPSTNTDETAPQPGPAASPAVDAAQGGAQEVAQAGDAPARGGQALDAPAAPELSPDDEIPMAWPKAAAAEGSAALPVEQAVHPVLAQAGFDEPALERAGLIAAHLQDAGLSADEAAVAAGSVVKRMGVVGDDYTAQMVEDGFSQAMKEAGFQRVPHKPTRWERKPSTARPVMTEAEKVPGSKSQVSSQGAKADNGPPLTLDVAEPTEADRRTAVEELKAQMPDADALIEAAVELGPQLARFKAMGGQVRVVKNAAEAAKILGHSNSKSKTGVTQRVNGVPTVVIINPKGNKDIRLTLFHELVHGVQKVYEALHPDKVAAASRVLDQKSPEFDRELYHFVSQEYGSFVDSAGKPLDLQQKLAEATRAIIEGRYRNETSSKATAFKGYLKDFLAYIKAFFKGSKNPALIEMVRNIETALGIDQRAEVKTEKVGNLKVDVEAAFEKGVNPFKTEDYADYKKRVLLSALERLRKRQDVAAAKKEYEEIKARLAAVEKAVYKLGHLFDGIDFVRGADGPMIVVRDGDQFRLRIDLNGVLSMGANTELGAELLASEEVIHALIMAQLPPEMVRRIARSLPDEAVDLWWKSYYAADITSGQRGATPPENLLDDAEAAYHFGHEFLRMLVQDKIFKKKFLGLIPTGQGMTTESGEVWEKMLNWLKELLQNISRQLKNVRKQMPESERAALDAFTQQVADTYKELVESGKSISEWVYWQREAAKGAAKAAAPKNELDDVEPPESKAPAKAGTTNYDDKLDAAWEAEQKARRKAPTFTPAQQALRGLRSLPDPDNGQVNILSRIAMEGGIAIYSDKVRKLRKQQGKPVGGELDWLERADIPPFWKGIVFRRGNQQNVDTIVGQLFSEGYFPEAAEQGDVTGEMLAAKIQDVLARYTAQKKGQTDVADADEQYGAEMSKLERQRVEFERATESGPLKVRPADLKPGDVMQVKGDDGKLHPVEVMRLETRPLEAGEEYDPQGNPGHRLGPDGPEVIESVTLKDGTTFGVQTIDGQEGLFVDEFSVKDGADFDERLREAVMSRKLDDADALLHFMDHYGMSPEMPLGEIVRQVQTRLKLPMKKAQQMLAAVFDTSAKDQEWSAAEKAAAMDSPLGSAPKRAAAKPLTPQDADNRAQMDWMNRQAQAMGAKDADELFAKKPDLFKRLAAEWRVKHARDGEGKFVQNEAIRGIFESLYGSKIPKTLGRDDAGNRSRSLAASAEAHTRGNLRPNEAGPASPTAESVRAEKARLIDWARDQNLLLQKLPEAFTPYSAVDGGMMEHHVFVAGDRMVKITREGNYGIWPVPHLGEFDLRNSASTPLRYLQRVLETNAILGEDLVLHGVLADRQGNVQIVTSQPRYSGQKANAAWSALPEDTPVAERDRVYHAIIAEVRDYFAQIGFAPVGSDNRTYYRPSDNTAVFDAHLSNLMWVDAEEGRLLVPFDVTVMHPSGELAENFKRLVPQGQPLGSSRKRDATPGLFGADTLNFLGDKNTLGLGEVKSSKSQVSSSGNPQTLNLKPETGFALESPTGSELDAEARRKKLREELQARKDKPLIGTQGDIGQMDMLGGNDLFSLGSAAKRAPFYSKLSRVITEKMPNRADSKTVTGLILNPQTGIKSEEIKWSGIMPWLAEQRAQGDKIDKQAVLDYLASDGAVKLEEVRMGGRLGDRYDPEIVRQINEITRQMHRYREDAANVYGEDRSKWPKEVSNGAEITRLKSEHSRLIRERDDKAELKETKFAQYQLPGGENYREVVLAMPEPVKPMALPPGWSIQRLTDDDTGEPINKLGVFDENGTLKYYGERPSDHASEEAAKRRTFEVWSTVNKDQIQRKRDNSYTSSHFPDVPNYVAHARLNDRVDAEGRPGTFIEEIQSDRHQAGRERGYAANDEGRMTNDELAGTVPDAPFRSTWPLQMFKRALADAVAAGKQWIGWTTGETQAERYDLSKQVDEIEVKYYAPVGGYLVKASKKNNVISEPPRARDESELAALIGKELAHKAVESIAQGKTEVSFSGLDLKVGGEGMKGFYDTILPKEIGKYVKQWGAGVVKGDVETGQMPFHVMMEDYLDSDEADAESDQPLASFKTQDEAIADAARRGQGFVVVKKQLPATTPIWRVDITPQMRAGVQTGQALFSGAKRRSFTANLGDSLKRSAAQGRAFAPSSASAAEGSAALPPTDLKRFIDAATRGLSTAYAPLERVFLAAKSVNRSLTEREFGRMISAADAAGQVVLEPAESPATVEKANVFGVRMAGGVPAWGVAWNPEMTGIEQAASGWSMVDTDAESSGNAAADVLRFEDVPDADLSDKQRDNLRALEALWRQDAGAGGQTSPLTYRRIQAATDAAGRSLVQFTRHFEDATGKKIEWVESDPALPLPWRAAVSPQRSNTIFVHARAPGNVLALIGHEWGHTLENQNPVLYRALQKQLAAYVTRKDYKTARAGLKDRYRRAIIRTELTNNVIGDFFTDAAFWREVEQQDRGLLRQALQSVMDWFRDMAAKLGSLWGTEQVLTDVAAARQAVAAAFAAAVRQGPYSELSASDDADLVKTIDQAAHEAATSPRNDLPEPTPAQKEAGNYAKGHVRIGGHEISIENPAGSKRRPEWPPLKDHYGYIRSVRVPKNGFAQSSVTDSETASNGSEAFPGPQAGMDAGKVVTDLVAAVSNIDLPSAENAAQRILVDAKSSGYLSARNAFANELLRRLKIPRDGSRKGIESQFVEAARDGLAADSKLFGDGVQGMLLRTQGFDALDIQGKAMVERHVRTAIQNPQVLRAVVQLVPVDVMNMLGGRKIFSTDDDAVLLERFTAALDNPVMIGRLIDGVAASLPAALALRIAERVGQSVKTPLAAMQNDPATGTGNGGHESPSTRVSPKGKDGDHVDVFVKPGTPTDFAGDVYVVRQITPATGRFDEWKVMMGYDSITEAEQAYRRNYTPGWKGLDSIAAQSMDDFTKHLAMGAFAQAKTGDTVLASAAKRGTVAKVAGFVGETVPLAILRGRGASAAIGALTGGAIGALTAGPVGAMYGAAAGAAFYGSHAVEKAGLQQVLAKMGSNNLDKFISKVVFGKAARWAGVDTAKKAVEVWLGRPGLLSKLAKGTLDQTVPLWNVPREWLAAYHESQRKAAWGREKAMDVIRALSHNAKVSDMAYPQEFVEDPAWRVKLFDAMEGKADMTTLPQPLQDLAARLRKLLKETGQELVRQGIMSLDTFEELSATGWMPRYTEEEAEAAGGSWLKAFKLGVKDLVAQRSTAWHIVDTTRKEKDGQYAIVSRDEAGKRNRWRFRNEQHRNAFYEDFIKGEAVKMLTAGGKDVTSLLAALDNDTTRSVRDEIKNLTRDKLDRPAELSENLRNVVRRAVELQRFRYKKEAPFEPDKLIKDPVYSVARYVMGATHNAATMELLKQTAKNPAWVSDTALAGFRQMPDNDRFGPLAGKYVRDEVATQVLDLVEVPGTVLGAYDSILRTWKAGKLVLNPGSHIRDAVGNIAFSVLSGSNPFNPGNLPYYRDAIAALRDGGDTYAELIEMQVLGGDAFTNEVKTALKGLLPDTKTLEGKQAGWIMRRIMGVGAGVRGSYEWAAAVRQVPDNLYKTAAYLKYKAAGMSPAEAAAEVRKWFPYYDRLGSSALIKQGSRFVMPFSSFFRESTRILGRGAVERPLAMASILGFATGITQISLMMLGLGDEDEESVFRSMRGKLKLGLSGDRPVFSMLLPTRTDEGQLQQWDISSVLPFADLLGTRVEMRQGEDEWTKFWRGLFTQSPILSTAWAWSTNTDAFSGRRIVEEDMGMLESTKERLREFGDTMLPPLTPWFGVHSNTIANAGRRMSSLDTRNATQSYLRAIVGLDVRSADPNLRTETEHFRKEKNLPLANSGSLYATPLKSRLGRQIKGELIQDAPDIDTVADALLRLEESGNPIKTRDDMEKLLKGLDPDRLIKEEYRRKLVQSFSPEALRVWRSQQSEFKAAQRRLPAVMKEASPLVKARRA